MGDIYLRRDEHGIDLESGGNTTEEDESKDQGLHDVEHACKLFGKLRSDSVGLNQASHGESLSAGLDSDENLETFADKFGEEMANVLENKMANEKRRKPNSKKPSKPPLAPKGPLLGTADMVLVKEISELAMLKRKRIERMKVLKRMKTEKVSSCNISFCAMVFTILFFFVIIFQGLLGSRV